MQALPLMTSGAAALGIGFGLGSFFPGEIGGDGTPSAEVEVKAVTFEGGPARTSTDRDSAAAFRQQFGIYSHSSYAAAKERLEELIGDYQSRTDGRSNSPSGIVRERILEEIEHILSRASEAELVGFLRGRSFDGQTDAIAQIAYGILARSNPEQAAEIWLAEREIRNDYQNPVDQPSSQALMREWVKRDPAAAARWLDQHDQEENLESARVAYYTVLAGTHPAQALSHLQEIAPDRGYHFARVLGENLDLSLMPAAAESFLAKRAEESGDDRMTGQFLSAWGQREPEAMKEWLLAHDLDALGNQTVSYALFPLIGDAPEDFLDRIGPALSKHDALRGVASSAFWKWVNTEGSETTAIQWLFSREDFAELADGFQQMSVYLPPDGHGDRTSDQSARIIEALTAAPDVPGKETLLRNYLSPIARSDPQLVLVTALEHLPLGQNTDNLVSQAISGWANKDPQAALRWSLENIETESTLNRAVHPILSHWAEQDAPAAAAAMMDLPDELRDSVSFSLTHAWSRNDPDGLLDFLISATDEDAYATVIGYGFRDLAKQQPSDRYLENALQLPPGKLRYHALRGLFQGWANADLDGGAEAIRQMPEGHPRNAAIQGFSNHAAHHAPETAIDLATRITAPDMRRRVLLNAGRAWIGKAPDQARAAIEAHSAIPDKVKTELLKRSRQGAH